MAQESADGTQISDQEAAVYDRQIRLWGVEVQRRMRSSMILFCGFTGLNAEICKNLVLSGVSCAILDPEMVREEDLGANFFLRQEDVGENRAEAGAKRVSEMNPLVKVSVQSKGLTDLTYEDLENNKYTLVCAADLPMSTQLHLDMICRQAGKPFFAAHSCGFYSYLFCDLGEKYSFTTKEALKQLDDEGERQFQLKSKEINYPALSSVLSVPLATLSEKFKQSRRRKNLKVATQFAMEVFVAVKMLHSFEGKENIDSTEALTEKVVAFLKENGMEGEAAVDFANATAVAEMVQALQRKTELSPVCAVVGGVIGQELLKVISGNDSPVDNFFFFDGCFGGGLIRRIAPDA